MEEYEVVNSKLNFQKIFLFIICGTQKAVQLSSHKLGLNTVKNICETLFALGVSGSKYKSAGSVSQFFNIFCKINKK